MSILSRPQERVTQAARAVALATAFVVGGCTSKDSSAPTNSTAARTAQAGEQGDVRNAKIVVNIPSGLFSRWWVYVDKTVVGYYVNASKTGKGDVTFSHEGDPENMIRVVGDDGISFLTDNDGFAIGRLSSRAMDSWFETPDISVSPGTHVVELFVDRGRCPPFATTVASVQLSAGQSTTIGFGVPWHFLDHDVPTALPAPPKRSTDVMLRASVDELGEVVDKFSRDLRVRELKAAAAQIANSSTSISIVRLNMPTEYGGSRYFEKSQVEAVVRCVKDQYKFSALDRGEDEEWTPSQLEALASLNTTAAKHNLEVERLGEAARLMEPLRFR